MLTASKDTAHPRLPEMGSCDLGEEGKLEGGRQEGREGERGKLIVRKRQKGKMPSGCWWVHTSS